MTSLGKVFWSLVIILIAAGAIASQFFQVSQQYIQQTSYTRNTGELTRDVLVGQTFIAPADNLNSIGIMFATYTNRQNTGEIHFHLRSSIDDRQDIRSGTVKASELGDNQIYKFSFEPIRDSKGKNYFFFVASPDSAPGNAVTVDFDAADPYPLGTAYLVRGQGPAITDPAVLSRSGRQTADLAFVTYHEVPLRAAVLSRGMAQFNHFIATWDQSRGNYFLWLRAMAPGLLFFGVLWVIRPRPYDKLVGFLGKFGLTAGLMAILLMAGLVLRFIYADQLSVTNDEGNYLYDAWALRQGILAGGDGYVKAPLVILWVAFWQILAGNTVMAGRIASVIAGVATSFPIYFLAKEMYSSKIVTKSWLPTYLASLNNERVALPTGWGRRIGLAAAAVWLLFGSGVVSNIYVHTQPVALFFGVAGLAALLAALRGNTPRLTFITSDRNNSGWGWFVLAGILLGLGVASRKSILALGLVPLLFILAESADWKARGKHILLVGTGFLAVISIFLAGSGWMYGTEGVWEAIGFNSAEDGILSTDPAELEQVRAYSLRGMTPFFRESLPLIVLAVIGFGVSIEQMLRAAIAKIKRVRSRQLAIFLDHVLPKAAWILSWLVFWWAWRFFHEYEGSAFMRWGIDWLWYGFAAILALVTLVPRAKTEGINWNAADKPIVQPSTQPGVIKKAVDVKHNDLQKHSLWRHLTSAITIPIWMWGLVFFYQNWIKFHANYISEFIPPLAIISGFGVVALYQRLRPRLFFGQDYPVVELARRAVIILISVTLFWSISVSNYITFLYEHTGTFDQRAIKQAADWAKAHIPPDQAIFTGAAVVPYLSGHHTALDIAHPRWYAYEFTRKDIGRLNTFLPPAEQMLQAFHDTRWFLLEQQTGFSFLMEYSEIEAGLEQDFVRVQGIDNGNNTLTFYERLK